MNTYDLTATQRPPRTARQLAGTSHVTNNLFRILFHVYVRSESFISCLFGLSMISHRITYIHKHSQPVKVGSFYLHMVCVCVGGYTALLRLHALYE
jgi:hypothetical protein